MRWPPRLYRTIYHVYYLSDSLIVMVLGSIVMGALGFLSRLAELLKSSKMVRISFHRTFPFTLSTSTSTLTIKQTSDQAASL